MRQLSQPGGPAHLPILQRFGTAAVGRFFGPVMIVWFVVIGACGVNGRKIYVVSTLTDEASPWLRITT